jgi:hypothetical protein
LKHRVRNIQGHPHAPTIPRFDGQKPLVVHVRRKSQGAASNKYQ